MRTPAEALRGSSLDRPVAAAMAVATVLLWLTAMGLAAARGDGSAVTGVGAVSFAVVGATIVWQHPENRLGWLFCSVGCTMALLGAGRSNVRRRRAIQAPGSLPAGRFAAWLSDGMSAPTVGVLAGRTAALPDGPAALRSMAAGGVGRCRLHRVRVDG